MKEAANVGTAISPSGKKDLEISKLLISLDFVIKTNAPILTLKG